MAEFLEDLLPIGVRLGAEKTEDFAVHVTRTASGGEDRQLLHGLPMGRWTIAFTMDRDSLYAKIRSLHRRAYGRYAGFRVRCLDDFSTREDGVSTPTPLDQTLVRLSSGVYQLVKRYGSPGLALSIGYPMRTIYKPVAGSTVAAVNGVTLSYGVSVNTTNGRVTISPAPLITDTVTAGCLFDLPCRFDSPLSSTAIGGSARDTGAIDLIELLKP